MTLRATLHASTAMSSAGTRAISYARYSTDMQDASSTPAQHRMNREFAQAMGWGAAREVSDYAITGQTNARDGYNEILDDIRTGRVDVIIAESLDRLVRNRVDTAYLWELSQFHEVEIHTLDRGLVTSVDIGIASLVNPMELEKIAQRTRRTQQHKVVDEGKSAGGKAYGYRVPVGENGLRIKGELEIVEKEATVVLRILREYADGRSPHDIACDLNRDGIPAPHSGKRKKSEPHWAQNTINGNRERGTGILNNEIYVGRRVWNRLEWKRHPDSRRRVPRQRHASEHKIADVPHLRIVSDDLWLAVKTRQDAQDARRPARSAKDQNGLSASQALRRPKYLLSPFLVCGCCGGKMTIAGSGKKRYYCATEKTKGKSVCKGMPGILQEEVEPFVLGGLKAHLMKDDLYQAFRRRVEAQMSALSERANAGLKALEVQIRTREKEVANLVESIAQGNLSKAVAATLATAETDLEALQARLASETPQVIHLPADLPSVYRAYVTDLTAALSHDLVVARASDELGAILDKVVIHYDHAAREHAIAIEGNLAGILGLGRRGGPTPPEGPDDPGPAGTPPHGGGSGRGRARAPANDKAPARANGGLAVFGAIRSGPTFSPSTVRSLKLVAGAGYNEGRTGGELTVAV